jgi:muramoyltetrapeptide carboxypeptidase
LTQLHDALFDTDCAYVWGARGGYGCSDLLALLDWNALAKLKHGPKIIGFSDISALHSAFYSKLAWKGIHGPMPATTLWKQESETRDVDAVIAGIRSNQWNGSFKLKERISMNNQDPTAILRGPLFGGCFSVLTNLIGTEFFPSSLANHILFLEDTGEHPGRLQRYLNQWIHSRALDGIEAIILGDFRDCCSKEDFCRLVAQPFAEKTKVPVFTTNDFGHISPNFPIMVGATGVIDQSQLKLSWAEHSDGRVTS